MLSVNMLRGLSRRGGAPVHGLSNRLSSSAAAAAVASSPSTAQTQTPHREPVFKTRRRQLLPFIESLALPPPTVEEAVNNILYNTPTDAATPVKRHTLNCLVANEPGVLSRISGILAGRGFNIESLVVARTEVPDLSRMTIVLHGQDSVIEQAHKQLEDIVPVWAVLDYTRTRVIEREILLIKVSVVPESAIKDNSPEGEALSLAPGSRARVGAEPTMGLPPLLASSVQRQALTDLSRLFEGRVVDVSLDSVTIELSAKPSRIDSFIELVKPFGIIEVARSGVMAMPRSSASASSGSTLDEDDTSTSVDATMLPPG